MTKDVIYRQAAIKAVHDEFDDCLVWDESGERTADEVENILYNLPSAQPEIIHCRDCKWWRDSDHTCGGHSLVSPMLANDFCSRAERR